MSKNNLLRLFVGIRVESHFSFISPSNVYNFSKEKVKFWNSLKYKTIWDVFLKRGERLGVVFCENKYEHVFPCFQKENAIVLVLVQEILS